MSWNEGYVADVNYTFGYYGEMSPARVDFALLLAGLEGLPAGPCCELGFGQGVSVNIHAAGDGSRRWWGTDFNPAQAAHARELVAVAGTDALLEEQSFAEFCTRDDLPQFALLALHGVWSWVSDANRRHIVALAQRRLLPGGVLYVGYNTPCGWSPLQPLRRVLLEHARCQAPASQRSTEKLHHALQFANRLLAADPLFARANPLLAERLTAINRQDAAYLVHEYMNADWLPMHFADLANWLVDSKLQYAGSAQPLDHLDALHLTDTQRELLAGIGDEVLRETVRELLQNQQFRRDLWVKGRRPLGKRQQWQRFCAQRLVLVSAGSEGGLKVNGARGEIGLQDAAYRPLLDALQTADGPISVAELARQLPDGGYDNALLWQTVVTLVGMGLVALAQSELAVAQARPYCDRLNAHWWAQADGCSDNSYNVSPVTGGGLSLGQVPQLILAARAAGCHSVDDWVAYARQRFVGQGRGLSKGGQAVQGEEAINAELRAQMRQFEQLLPSLRRLQIV